MRGNMLRTSGALRTGLPDRNATVPFHVGSQKTLPQLKNCFITETLHAGVGQHIVDSITELSRRGHEIHLIYSPIRCETKFLAKLVSQANVYCVPVPMRREIGLADIAAFAAIKNYVRAKGPFDIIHGHSSKGGGYARLLKLVGARTIAYSPHAFVTLSPVVGQMKRLIYRWLEWSLARITDRIICTSRGELEHARALGIARERLALIPNGSSPKTGPTRSVVRAKLGISSDQIIVGFVGRMEDQKAPQRLIAAVRELLRELPNLKVLMIGDGPKRQFLEAQLERAGLKDRAIWLGAVNARNYMCAMDVFVLPSLYEGFAYVLIEALYAGLPIVSTPVGGSQESVTPGMNGLIVPHDAPEEMRDAIRAVVTDGGLRRRMGEASRTRAEHFSIPRMVDSLEDSYYRLVGQPGFAEAGASAAVSSVGTLAAPT
jgi:glycosyltransferase involved in cell wall biosynthesis